MGGQVVPIKDRVAALRSLLDKAKPQLEMAVPRHLTVDRLMRIAMTSVQRNPKLLEATQVSLLGAIMEAAQLGLEPDTRLGHVYLVPFKNRRKRVLEVQLMIGYKGMIQLAYNSGKLSHCYARTVYEKDRFKVTDGLDQSLVHERSRDPQTDKDIAGFYACAHLLNGGKTFEHLWKWEVDQVRDRFSKSKDDGPWVTDYSAMGQKTALRKLLKPMPMSIEVQRAVALDESAEAGIPQDLDISIPGIDGIVPPESEPSALDQIVDEEDKKNGKDPEADKGKQGILV